MQRIANKLKRENTRHSHDGLVRFMTSPPKPRKEQIAWSIARGNGGRYNLCFTYRSPHAKSFQARQHFIAEVGKLVQVIHEGDRRPDKSGVADFRQLRRHIVWVAD